MHVVSYPINGSFSEARDCADLLQDQCASIGIVPNNDDHTAWVLSWQFKDMPDLSVLAKVLETDVANLSTKEVPNADWLEAVYQADQRIETDLFLILHPMAPKDNPDNKHIVYLESAHAFGTGGHPTTLGCIHLIERLYKEGYTPKTILDIGCGSGILSLCAAKLWPNAHITALDIEAESIETVTMLWEANGFDPSQLTAHKSKSLSALDKDQSYDLVLANILPIVLRDIADDIENISHTGTRLILSGILEDAKTEMSTLFSNKGFSVVDTHVLEDWHSLLLTRR